MALTPAQLEAALWRAADGHHASEAAVQLLVDHGTWLRRGDFAPFIDLGGDEGTIDPETEQAAALDTAYAGVRWADAAAALDAGGLPASGSERRMLLIACSLGGGVPVNLQDVISDQLDVTNRGIVMQAFRRAWGWATSE